MKNPNIAVFIAGDENIVLPALHSSLTFSMDHGHIERFLCVPVTRIPASQVSMAGACGVHVLDTEQIPLPFGESVHSSYAWPAEVYANYMLPSILLEKGFDYSIKLDFDTLCVRPVQHSDIIPVHDTFSGNRHFMPVGKMFSDRALVAETFGLNQQQLRSNATNVGVVGFNNRAFSQSDFFSRMVDVYTRLSELKVLSPDFSFFADQAVFNLTALLLQPRVTKKEFHTANNYTIQQHPYIGHRRARVIHYVTPYKPWKREDSLMVHVRWPSLHFYTRTYQTSVDGLAATYPALGELSVPIGRMRTVLLSPLLVAERVYVSLLKLLSRVKKWAMSMVRFRRDL